MAKALVQLALLAGGFFALWFGLSAVPFTRLLRVEELSRENEHRIGTYLVEAFKRGAREIESDSGRALPAAIKKRICEASAIADSSVTLHIVESSEVNAFSLPDRHLIINTGLIVYCASADELAGVIAHEIAHILLHLNDHTPFVLDNLKE